MASLGKKFDATQHDTEQRDYAELPEGVYKLEMEASDVKETTKKNGTILSATFVVIEPEQYKGRKLFGNYNLENANPQAQEIGQKQFASLCRAVGLADVDDSEELHFRSFTAKVGLGKSSKSADGRDYPARAEIKRYFFEDEGDVPAPEVKAPANDNQPAQRASAQSHRQPAPTQQQASTPAPAASGKRPWGSR